MKIRSSVPAAIATKVNWFLVATLAVFLLVKASYLNGNDPIFTHPFLSFDSFQWITDGLFYTDHTFHSLQRNPALPLIFLLLRKLELLWIFPVLQNIVLLMFFVGQYLLIRHFQSKSTALMSVFVSFLCFKTHAFFDFVLADPWCVTLMLYSTIMFLASLKRPVFLLGAFTLLAIAFNFQFAPVFIGPAILWFLLNAQNSFYFLKTNLRYLVLSGLLFFLLASPQFIFKWIVFGSPLYSQVTHFPLVKFHLYGLPYYLVGFIAWVGWPHAIGIIWGFVKALSARDVKIQFINISLLSIGTFWILFYEWLDVRFLLYLLPFWFVYFAKAVSVLLEKAIPKLSLAPLPLKIVTCAFALFSVSLPMKQLDAFDAFNLPLTPQYTLQLGQKPVKDLPTFVPTLENTTTLVSTRSSELFEVFGYFRYYKYAAIEKRKATLGLQNELASIKALVSGAPVALCGALATNHATRHRVTWALGRNLADCGSAQYQIYEASQSPNPSNTLYAGKALALVETRR